MNLFLIFFTGLTTGGISCLALQGGLLASVMANATQVENSPTEVRARWTPLAMFLGSKLLAHILLGLVLGWLGSALTLSLGVRLTFQTLAAFFMFATAMNLLNVHPWFRWVALQPPKFLFRYIRKSTRSQALFAPALLGFLTIFIPCGVTQAMEVLAISSGQPILGAAILASFVLGTMPLFVVLGVATSRLTSQWQTTFSKFAAALLIFMALYSLNGVLLVMNAPITWQKLTAPVRYFFSNERFGVAAEPGISDQAAAVQKIKIGVFNNGYRPNRLTVKRGRPVELTLESQGTYSCALAFEFKEFGISTFLEANDSQVFTFTPDTAGTFTFTCSMGMYSGTLQVVD